jgi:hypothetical protein
VLLCGCRRWPDSYPPPEQIPAVAPPPPTAGSSLLELQGQDVDRHILRDVMAGYSEAPWRWTGQRPLLKVDVGGTVGVDFFVDYTIPEGTFQHTGPVTITFFVNSQPFAAVHAAKSGRFQFEKPVWDFTLHAGEENTVGAEIDKVWTDPKDGHKYGFILHSIGFIPAGASSPGPLAPPAALER